MCVCICKDHILGGGTVSGVKEGRIKNNSKVMIADELEYVA